MSDVLVKPEVVEPSTDEPTIAHIVTKEDQMRGYVFGEKVTALCGIEWIPSRDYEGKEVCRACFHELQQINACGDN